MEFANREQMVIDAEKLKHSQILKDMFQFSMSTDDVIKIDILNKKRFRKFIDFINGPLSITSEKEIVELIYFCDFFDVRDEAAECAIKNLARFAFNNRGINTNGRVEAFIRNHKWRFLTDFLLELYLYTSFVNGRCIIKHIGHVNNFSLYKEATKHICLTSDAIKIISEYSHVWMDVLSYCDIDNISVTDPYLAGYFRNFLTILPEKIISLDISKCCLPANYIGILLEHIGYKNLESLDISYNLTSHLDFDSIGRCKNLKKLVVNGCSGSLYMALEGIKTTLLSLDAEDFPLTELDYFKILRCPNLEELNIANCNVSETFLDLILNSEFSKNLKRLCLEGNTIYNETAEKFIFLPNLDTLHFNGKNLIDTVLVEHLQTDKLRNLEISEMVLTSDLFDNFYCPKMTNLVLFDVNFNNIRFDFLAFPNLESLQLTSSGKLNYLDLRKIKSLKKLKILKIDDLNNINYSNHNNFINPNGNNFNRNNDFNLDNDTLNNIASCTLSTLHISYNNLKNADLKTLKKFAKIKKLDIEHTNLSYIKIELPKTLTELFASFNEINSGTLSDLENLRILDISQCFVENYDFLQKIPFQKTLEHLDVGNNILSWDDLYSISQLSFLKELSLKDTYIDGLDAFKHAVFLKNNLEVIDLRGLTLSDSDLEILSQFSNIRILKMNDCNFKGLGIRIIINSAKLCRSLNHVFIKQANFKIRDLEDLKLINSFVRVHY